MKLKTQISASILMVSPASINVAAANSTFSYITGSVSAPFIMDYLISSYMQRYKF